MGRATGPGGQLRRLARLLDLGSIRRIAGATLVVNLLGNGLRFLFQFVYARWLGPVGYGHMVLALSWSTQLAPPSTLGLNYSVISFLPEYEAHRRFGLVRGLVPFPATFARE